TVVGFIILFLGLAILLKNLDMGVLIPGWLFGWEMMLIVIGLVIGVNSKFKKKSAMVLITVGGIFLLKDIIGLELGRLILPAAAIGLGFYLIIGSRSGPLGPALPSDARNAFDGLRRGEPPPA